MGLDNGFLLSHEDMKCSIEIAYFRKFYELDLWMSRHAWSESVDGEITVNLNVLEDLERDIEAAGMYVCRFTDNELNYMQGNNKWPESIRAKLAGTPFDVTADSMTAFFASKVKRLYRDIQTMKEILSMNEGAVITFYSSY